MACTGFVASVAFPQAVGANHNQMHVWNVNVYVNDS